MQFLPSSLSFLTLSLLSHTHSSWFMCRFCSTQLVQFEHVLRAHPLSPPTHPRITSNQVFLFTGILGNLFSLDSFVLGSCDQCFRIALRLVNHLGEQMKRSREESQKEHFWWTVSLQSLSLSSLRLGCILSLGFSETARQLIIPSLLRQPRLSRLSICQPITLIKYSSVKKASLFITTASYVCALS